MKNYVYYPVVKDVLATDVCLQADLVKAIFHMKKGFTLVELLVVISILGILSTIGLAVFGGTTAKARDSIRKNDLTHLGTALELYLQENNQYVSGTDTCANATFFDTAIAPLMPSGVPKDPKTGGNYCYKSDVDGTSYSLTATLDDGTLYELKSEDYIAAASGGGSPSFMRVFVTSTTYNGNLGGIDGANAKCQARADAENLGGSWKAWVSGDITTNMTNRVFTRADIPYKLLDETLIANNWNDLLDETIQNPINLDETRQMRNGISWTGTNADGTWANNSCNGWTENSASWVARTGSTTSKDSGWTAGTFPTCEKLYSLYCFEQ